MPSQKYVFWDISWRSLLKGLDEKVPKRGGSRVKWRHRIRQLLTMYNTAVYHYPLGGLVSLFQYEKSLGTISITRDNTTCLSSRNICMAVFQPNLRLYWFSDTVQPSSCAMMQSHIVSFLNENLVSRFCGHLITGRQVLRTKWHGRQPSLFRALLVRDFHAQTCEGNMERVLRLIPIIQLLTMYDMYWSFA